jgi:pimeloyl-ACP methyl ester carboxylesterase
LNNTPTTEAADERAGGADGGCAGIVPWGAGLVTGMWGTARSFAGDPRVMGVLRAGPRVGGFLARSAVRNAVAGAADGVVRVRPSPALALQAYADEVLMAVFRHPDLVPGEAEFGPAAADLAATRELFLERGWLERPATYHRDLGAPRLLTSVEERSFGLSYEHATFASEWEPDQEEPGRERWLAHEANRTVHAWVARAPGGGNGSWLVCGHGFGMGSNPFVDLRAFRVPLLHRLGINVVVPVLPLHGPRSSGRVRGEDLMTIDLVDSMHGIAQATSDLRRLVRWAREEQGAASVGVMGYSLGALVASVVASLEDDLSCVVAGIPVVGLPDLFRRHTTPRVRQLARRYAVLGTEADDVHRVVSPLALSCKVPVERRYVFAGLADRMSTFGQARRLWLHWERPTLATYPGGHIGFFWSGSVRRLVRDAMTNSLAA